ncbi:hypothetical protein ACFP2T_13530 [Plantactinospora solaniradicis]|uniref:Terminase n=1 Tax=Plantactinospora solaniradicis TaxID=1723736 RepID=A0ABW1K8Q5_9ACTN
MRRARQPLDDWQVDGLTLMAACRSDGQWACYEYCEWVSRQNGKGGILEARVLLGFLLLGEQLILWSAHLYKTAMELFRRVRTLIRALGRRVKPHDDNLWFVPAVVVDPKTGEPREDVVIVKISNTNGDEGFERLDTGARILFLARSAGGGRGMSGDVNIIDETFAYTRDQHAALLYTLSARPNAQIIYTSSPPLKGDTGEIMYDLRRRGDPTALRDPEDGAWEQDDSLGYRDWGHAGDLDDIRVDIDDMAVAAAANPALGAIRSNGSGLTLETVQRELKSDRAGYPRERLGIWPREIRQGRQSGPIPAELWRDLIVTPEIPADVAFAAVVNHKRTHTAIVAVGRREDGRWQASIVAYQPGTHWVVNRLVDLRNQRNPLGIAVQDKGPSATLIEPLSDAGIDPPEDRDEPSRRDLAVPYSNDVAVAYGMTIDALAQRQLVHLDEHPFNVAVAAAATRSLPSGGTTWDYTADGAELLQALSLAYWLAVTWAGVDDDYEIADSFA